MAKTLHGANRRRRRAERAEVLYRRGGVMIPVAWPNDGEDLHEKWPRMTPDEQEAARLPVLPASSWSGCQWRDRKLHGRARKRRALARRAAFSELKRLLMDSSVLNIRQANDRPFHFPFGNMVPMDMEPFILGAPVEFRRRDLELWRRSIPPMVLVLTEYKDGDPKTTVELGTDDDHGPAAAKIAAKAPDYYVVAGPRPDPSHVPFSGGPRYGIPIHDLAEFTARMEKIGIGMIELPPVGPAQQCVVLQEDKDP